MPNIGQIVPMEPVATSAPQPSVMIPVASLIPSVRPAAWSRGNRSGQFIQLIIAAAAEDAENFPFLFLLRRRCIRTALARSRLQTGLHARVQIVDGSLQLIEFPRLEALCAIQLGAQVIYFREHGTDFLFEAAQARSRIIGV